MSSGREAFKMARGQSNMIKSESPANTMEYMVFENREAAQSIKRDIGAYTFYLRDGVWRDSRCKPGVKTKQVAYMSDEYFALLAKAGDLSGAFTLGERLIVLVDGTTWEVVPATP